MHRHLCFASTHFPSFIITQFFTISHFSLSPSPSLLPSFLSSPPFPFFSLFSPFSLTLPLMAPPFPPFLLPSLSSLPPREAVQKYFRLDCPPWPCGAICAARYTEDRIWYRAQVESLSCDSHVTVRYIDFGNAEEISVKYVRPLDPRFWSLPCHVSSWHRVM